MLSKMAVRNSWPTPLGDFNTRPMLAAHGCAVYDGLAPKRTALKESNIPHCYRKPIGLCSSSGGCSILPTVRGFISTHPAPCLP